MKILNNSVDYSTYNKEQHIQNLKRLSDLRLQAESLGTGTMGVDAMIQDAVKAAIEFGLSTEDIAKYLNTSEENLLTMLK